MQVPHPIHPESRKDRTPRSSGLTLAEATRLLRMREKNPNEFTWLDWKALRVVLTHVEGNLYGRS